MLYYSVAIAIVSWIKISLFLIKIIANSKVDVWQLIAYSIVNTIVQCNHNNIICEFAIYWSSNTLLTYQSSLKSHVHCGMSTCEGAHVLHQ